MFPEHLLEYIQRDCMFYIQRYINQTWCEILIIFVGTASIHHARLFDIYDVCSPFHAIPLSRFVPSSVFRWLDHRAMPPVSSAIIHLGDVAPVAGILKLWKRFRMSQTSFEHGINSIPLVCFRNTWICPKWASQYHTWPSGHVVLRCCMWINFLIRKQGVTNNTLYKACNITSYNKV